MGWEDRRDHPYYYRSVREGNRVRKEYRGGGILGQVAACLDELVRLQKEEETLYWRQERQRFERNAEFVKELDEVAGVLTRALLIAAGYAQRKGEWRRQREHRA